MSTRSKLALTLGLLLGFAALAGLFTWLGGARPEVLGVLAAAFVLSTFVLWAAASGSRGD